MSPAWLWVLVAIQVAVPASYYLGVRGEDDERFAWRMFSAVRLKRCTIEAFDADPRDAQGVNAARVDLAQAVHASWARSLTRGREYVIERFLGTRCEHEGVRVATMTRRCHWPSGRRMPDDYYVLDCEAGRFAHETAAPSTSRAAEAAETKEEP